MKRTIEIKTHIDSTGYYVTLIINGKAFNGEYHEGCDIVDPYEQINAGIDEVYGEKLDKEVYEHMDIHAAMTCVWNLIKAMDGMFQFQNGKE